MYTVKNVSASRRVLLAITGRDQGKLPSPNLRRVSASESGPLFIVVAFRERCVPERISASETQVEIPLGANRPDWNYFSGPSGRSGPLLHLQVQAFDAADGPANIEAGRWLEAL
jgi:hypothetical protein